MRRAPFRPTLARALVALICLPAAAMASPADLCRAAALRAADHYGIPREILAAITLVETRRRVDGVSGPWPWTLNIHGDGFWFDTKSQALQKAQEAIARGQTSVDLGCFQLNYRWHGQAFDRPEQMLDPTLAADYAARFLRDLHAETGDWLAAAGHYHSRTHQHATRYRGLIQTAMASLDHLPSLPPPPQPPEPQPPTGPRAGFAVARAHEGTQGGTRRAPGSLWSQHTGTPGAAPGAVGLASFGGPRASLFAKPSRGTDG